MGSVRVAIVGVGNCASSLIQGVEYYRNADPADRVPGLMHVTFGDYHVSDVQFVAAFDVDAKKVGFDLSEAINNSENNTIKITDVPPIGVTVQRGPTLDGLGKYYLQTIEESDAEPVDVVQALKDAEVDVLVSYLPVGSEQADKFYAQCAIDAKVAFVNALPVFIASDPEWAAKFEAAGVPMRVTSGPGTSGCSLSSVPENLVIEGMALPRSEVFDAVTAHEAAERIPDVVDAAFFVQVEGRTLGQLHVARGDRMVVVTLHADTEGPDLRAIAGRLAPALADRL